MRALCTIFLFFAVWTCNIPLAAKAQEFVIISLNGKGVPTLLKWGGSNDFDSYPNGMFCLPKRLVPDEGCIRPKNKLGQYTVHTEVLITKVVLNLVHLSVWHRVERPGGSEEFFTTCLYVHDTLSETVSCKNIPFLKNGLEAAAHPAAFFLIVSLRTRKLLE